jgi:hypothetical protein
VPQQASNVSKLYSRLNSLRKAPAALIAAKLMQSGEVDFFVLQIANSCDLMSLIQDNYQFFTYEQEALSDDF